MKKKVIGLALGAMLFALSYSAEAQQPTKVPRIGYLTGADAATESARSEGIRLALRERGYVDGQNIAIEYRYAEGKRGQLPALTAELVRLNVNIIVAGGGESVIEAAKNATKTIPIVMVGGGSDPFSGPGLIPSQEITEHPHSHQTTGIFQLPGYRLKSSEVSKPVSTPPKALLPEISPRSRLSQSLPKHEFRGSDGDGRGLFPVLATRHSPLVTLLE